VIGSVWGLLVVGAILASSAMALMWLLQLRLRDASHVDVAWAVLIACCAIAYALLADGDVGHRMLAAALASIWGFRLGGYLLFNRVLGKEEDGRYRELRRRWAPHENRNFFVFFQAQALFVVFFSLPFAFISLESEGAFGTLAWIGIAVWAIGNVGTILSDYQLAQWRKSPENKGKTARGGLWGWSRHPNYFFEWVHWWAYALLALGAPYAWTALLGPVSMLFFLFKITGIPPTEKRALASRGEAYRDYQRTTSVFFPWPPKENAA
jgi:steroid 5-alpha reductase family enzyme